MDIARHYTGFLTKDAITTAACVILLIAPLSACNDSDNHSTLASSPPSSQTINPAANEGLTINSILNSIEGTSKDVQDAMAPHASAVQARTKEEVDKLFRWEYKVVELLNDIPANELEVKLGGLGSDGWECFQVSGQVNSLIRLICKRRPTSALSYLKYIPGL